MSSVIRSKIDSFLRLVFTHKAHNKHKVTEDSLSTHHRYFKYIIPDYSYVLKFLENSFVNEMIIDTL